MTVRRVIWNDTVWEGGSITVALRLGPRIEPEIQIKKFAQLGSWETTTTGRKTPVVCLWKTRRDRDSDARPAGRCSSLIEGSHVGKGRYLATET